MGDLAPPLDGLVDAGPPRVPGLRTVCFLRSATCPVSRAVRADFAGIADLFVVRRGHLPGALSDGDGALARAWHLGRDRAFLCSLRGIRVKPLGTTLRAALRGDELMSAFIVDDAGVIRHAWHACHVADTPDPHEFRAASLSLFSSYSIS